MDVLFFYIISVIGIVAGIVAVIAAFIACGLYAARKLVFGNIPWLVWLTLDEVVLMGHSRFWCEVWLPIFHRAGSLFVGCKLAVRLRSDLSEYTQEFALEHGFVRYTVCYYEFKFTSSSSGGGRWKRQKSGVEILQPMPLRGSERTNR